jgi:methyltransferase (TIGR00027 family)
VAFSRALGNLKPEVEGFSDPIAEKLLPERWQRRVDRMRRRLPRAPFPFWMRGMGVFNQFRTVVLDRALRGALPFEQLVILGAGLDGRAWRLPELAASIVYEVDHPDTQAWKRERAGALPSLAREVRFVAVDFAQDDLAKKLLASGYSPNARTFWLWEGVTMYLAPEDVRRTLEIARSLCGAGGGLALTYLGRRDGKAPRSTILALLGEPLRAAFEAPELSALGADTGWATVEDTGVQDWQPRLAPRLEITRRTVGLQWFERIWAARTA